MSELRSHRLIPSHVPYETGSVRLEVDVPDEVWLDRLEAELLLMVRDVLRALREERSKKFGTQPWTKF